TTIRRRRWTGPAAAVSTPGRTRCATACCRPDCPPPHPWSQHMSTPARQTSSLAVVSLVSGILGWTLLPLIGSIVAIITGHMARGEIRRAPERMDGDGLAVGGLILGYTMLVLGTIGIVVALVFFGGLIWLGLSS